MKFSEKATGVAYTVSIFSGKNATGMESTSTIGDINSDDVLRRYMEMYTEFRVQNFKHQVIFNHTGNFDMRPMTIASAYSPNYIIHPRLEYEKLNAMTTVRHQGTDRTWSKSIDTASALAALGIAWCPTSEWLEGRFNAATPLYGEQLPVDRGASLHIKVDRPSYKDDAALPEATTCRAISIWTLSFRGRKGVSDITIGPMGQPPQNITQQKNYLPA